MMLPARFDYRKGWAFAVEERENCNRVHWLAPLLVIDEASRSAVRAGELTFELFTAAAQTLSGKVQHCCAVRESSYLVSAGTAAHAADDGNTEANRLDHVMEMCIRDRFKERRHSVGGAAQGVARHGRSGGRSPDRRVRR